MAGQLDKKMEQFLITMSGKYARFLALFEEELNRAMLRESQKICPECQKPMVTFSVEGLEVESCKLCRGVWFDRGELKRIFEKSK